MRSSNTELTALLQFVGQGQPHSKGEDPGVSLAKAALAGAFGLLRELWVICTNHHQDVARKFCEEVWSHRSLHFEERKLELHLIILLGKEREDAVAYDIDAIRAALRGPYTQQRWPQNRAAPASEGMEDALLQIVSERHKRVRPTRWIVSTVKGTSQKQAALLCELTDALYDRADRDAKWEDSVSVALDASQLRESSTDWSLRVAADLRAPLLSAGVSDRARIRLFSQLPHTTPVLLTGPTGVGKSWLARSLHEQWWPNEKLSPEFLSMNCAQLSAELASAELFGSEAGAYTGARNKRIGVFGYFQRNKGTLFLDEFGELPQRVQAQLLTALDLRNGAYAIRPVGATTTTQIPAKNVRLVFATNRLVSDADVLRTDLFARVGRVPVHLPPVRETRWKIPAALLRALGQFQQDSWSEGVCGLEVPRSTMTLLHEFILRPENEWTWNLRDVDRLALSLYLQARMTEKRSEKKAVLTREHVKNALRSFNASSTNQEQPRRTARSLESLRPILPDDLQEFLGTQLSELSWLSQYEAMLLWTVWNENPSSKSGAWKRLQAIGAYRSKATNETGAFTERCRAIFAKPLPKR